jgi:hypothetical protein
VHNGELLGGICGVEGKSAQSDVISFHLVLYYFRLSARNSMNGYCWVILLSANFTYMCTNKRLCGTRANLFFKDEWSDEVR